MFDVHIAMIIPALRAEPVKVEAFYAEPEPAWLRKQVGGWLEAVPLLDSYCGHPAVAYCNEEGKLQGLPVNERATHLWWLALGRRVDDVLVGNVVLLVTMPDDVRKDADHVH